MPKEQSWENRTAKKPVLDEAQFTDVIFSANEILQTAHLAMTHAQPHHALELMEGFEKIHGNTRRPGGNFRVLDVITPAMVGDSEIKWFRDIAAYGKMLMNSLAGRENVNDPRPHTQSDVMGIVGSKPDALVFYSKLNRAINQITGALPPEQTKGK